MDTETAQERGKAVHDGFVKPVDLLRWLEEQQPESHISLAQDIFDDLLARSSQVKTTAVGSCVKLCGFVEACTKSRVPTLKAWAFSEGISLRLFNFFIEWNEVEQHRSMRLILDILPILINKNPSADTGRGIKHAVLDILMSIVGRRSSRPLVKSSLKALEQFTNKGLFSVEEIGDSYRRVHTSERWETTLDLWSEIFAQLFLRMAVWHIRAIAGKYIVTAYQAIWKAPAGAVQGRNGENFTLDVWLAWLQAALEATPTLLDSMKNYVFLPLFKDDRKESLRLLKHMSKADGLSPDSGDAVDLQFLLRFTALEVGKKVGIVEEPGNDDANGKPCIVLEEPLLHAVLSHPAPDVRSLAVSLIISSNSTTKPFTEISLQLLKTHLPHFFSDPGARFRMELLSKLKQMYKRARGALPVLRKAIERLDTLDTQNPGVKGKISQSTEVTRTWPREKLEKCWNQHRDFLTWVLRFLKSELIPTASYQRHYSVVRATLLIIKVELDDGKAWDSSTDDFSFFEQFDVKWTRALLDLIMDPFEDVRASSTEVLRLLYSDKRFHNIVSSRGSASALTEFLSRAEVLAKRTARADHSDGVARCYELLCRFRDGPGERLLVVAGLVDLLEGKLSLAELDLGKAVLEAPAHSYFASLRFVWQSMMEGKYSDAELDCLVSLQNRLIKCCQRIWAAVKHVLCDDSPEGHMPQELEETDGLDTKDVLSYSFRAVHEASNLMRAIVLALKANPHSGVHRPSVDAFAAIGNLTFEQLTFLRHRGAFSTVSLTFATCCQVVKYLDETSRTLPEDGAFLDLWYKGSINCIMTHASTTRRSAGIPSMITGILSADAESPSCDKVVKDLTEIARKEAFVSETDGSNLPQVHALNSLKDILKSSQLTQLGKVEPHIPECLKLAAGCLKSEVWAIRNSGLLLLRSLIDSLFGTNESKATIDAGWDGKATRLRYHQYPVLPGVLLNLLRTGKDVMRPSTGTIAAESVFPALDIIRRAGPPEALRDELFSLVAEYLGSSVWHVRDMAARALCSFMLHDGWIDAVTGVVYRQGISLNRSNHLHGALLTIKYVFERLTDVLPSIAQRDVPRLLDLVLKLYVDNSQTFAKCSEATSTYVDILNLVATFVPQRTPATAQDALLQPVPRFATNALLDGQLAIQQVHYAYERANLGFLATKAVETALTKPEAAVEMLEAIPIVFGCEASSLESHALSLGDLYVAVCNDTVAAEPRAVAMQNLADLIDRLLSAGRLDAIPSDKVLRGLWKATMAKTLNPTLHHAILRLSGCILTTALVRRGEQAASTAATEIANWSAMIADAGTDDKPFDTRFAAVSSLRSFLAAAPFAFTAPNPAYLPVLVALYDALNDDDEDVRDLASLAARPVLDNQLLLPLEAADRLLTCLGTSFAGEPAYRTLVIGRMTGSTASSSATRPVRAHDQFARSLQYDDALFAVEEQNLYIDEVRESRRWAAAFAALSPDGADEDTRALVSWAVDGLDAILAYAAQHDDGPMGWTTQADVYAVCARVVLCAVAVTRCTGLDASGDVARKLEELRSIAQEKRFHGLLMDLLEL